MEVPKNDEFFNGFGHFCDNGREYEIILEGENRPPSPWINVISNKDFGFLITESGAGSTWAYNSRENKLTPWSNDPVSDFPSEAIYLRDETTGQIQSPVSMGRSDRGGYRVRHGFGYTVFLHEEDEIGQQLTVFTPLDEPLKIWQLKLTNRSDRDRSFSLNYYVEWVLGIDRSQTNPYIITDYNSEFEYLTAKCIYTYHFRKHQAFIFSSETVLGFTGDRREFLGPKGSVINPAGLDINLSGSTGAGLDTCGAIRVALTLPPHSEKTVLFVLGESEDSNQIDTLRLKYQNTALAERELDRVKAYWSDILGTVQVETSDRAIDILVNGWLLYQTIACRIIARTAFYQCGGAFGFRDQLQDTLSLKLANPLALREQIKISCSRQFEEGDVQHWWHPPTGVGVRTRITDDLLWLPYATAAYLSCTQDYTLLEERVAYLQGEQLNENQHDIMFTPEQSKKEGSVYEHCKRTIQITHLGPHGLPLMGGGDWNDGMNKVGVGGTGESVWLAWFFYKVLGDFIPACEWMKDMNFAGEMRKLRAKLQAAIEEHAWDGEWYLRAFYDDGSKLGSKENDECKIDSISQSWSVISQAAEPKRAAKAIQSAWDYLVKPEYNLSLLLTPAFDKTEKDPGYIKNYLPGIRENGGQYTHAAVWLAIAAATAGDADRAYTLFTLLNPIHTTSDTNSAILYEREPYVMTADIAYGDGYSGKGGWSWYTGSAGWAYQGLVFSFLGLQKEGNYIKITPAVPSRFGAYTIRYRYGSALYHIRVEAAGEVPGPVRLIVDDGEYESNKIPLTDDGKEHRIAVYR